VEFDDALDRGLRSGLVVACRGGRCSTATADAHSGSGWDPALPGDPVGAIRRDPNGDRHACRIAPPAARRPARVLLTSLVTFVWMGFTVLFPILAPIGREMGLSEFQITFIIGASAIVVFLCSRLWGRRSDVWGRKRVLLVGLFGFTAAPCCSTPCSTAGLSGGSRALPLFGP
jgi:hypothetical protein